jgi:hypothetical protein
MRFNTSTRFLVLIAVLSLLLPSVLFAQSTTTGAISGTVTDSTGAVLPDITVTLKSTERGNVTTVKTNGQGFYQFSLVQPGTYTITIAAASFKGWTETTTVSVDQNTIANAKLEVGAAGTTVEVSGEAPLLQGETAEISTTFNEREISEVPNPGNDLSFIAQTAAGSVMNTGSGYGNFSSFGLSASSNLFTLNGMYDNDPFLNLNNSGATNLLLGNNEVAEATVVTNGYSGQYGGFVGANINYITKSGSNNWHGNANYWWNGRVMNANDYFHTDYSDPSNDLPRGFDNANQYAASFGGPIIKNKAFFFWNYEGLRVIIPVTNNGLLAPSAGFETAVNDNLNATGFSQSVPFYNQAYAIYNNAPGNTAYSTAPNGSPGSADPTGCVGNYFSDPTTGNNFGINPVTGVAAGNCTNTFSNTVGNFTHEYVTSGRFDFNLTNNDKLFVRLQEDIGTQATATDALDPIFNSTSYQPEYQSQVSWNRAFGAKAANNLLFSMQYYRAIFGPANLPAALAAFPTTMFPLDGSLSTVGGIDEIWPQGRNVTGYQVVDDYSYNLTSKHTLKAGIYFHRNLISDHDMGAYTSGLSLPFSLAQFYTGGSGVIEQDFPISEDEPVKLYQLGFYVQDEWKPRSDLKLTLALRGDHNATPTCGTNCFARLSGSFADVAAQGVNAPYNQAITTGLNNAVPSFTTIAWQPRFGFAYSPSWAKNTVFRGGFGIFMDTFQGSIADSLIENTPQDNFFVVVGNISPGQIANGGNGFLTASQSNTALVNGFNAGENLTELQATVAAEGGSFSPPSFTTVGNIVAPTTQEWNLEVQHSFGNNTSLIVNYVGSHGIHETVGFNGLNGYCPTVDTSGAGNDCPSGFPGLPTTAPDQRFVTVTDIRTVAVSHYNGLNITAQHRFNHGLQLQANYLWGHSLDEVSNGGLNPFIANGYGNSLLNPVNNNNLRASYGNADYDVRHSFSANYVYEIPKGPTPVLKGWQLSGTFFWRTGFPFTAINTDASGILSGYGFGGPVYGNYTGGGQVCRGTSGSLDGGINPCLPYTVVNGSPQVSNFPDLVTANSSGGAITVGQAQLYSGTELQRRNQFYGPHYFDTDFTVMKYTQIPHWETAKLGVGVQFFNFFNHPNFAAPVNDESSPNFGQVRSTVNPPTSILGSFLGGDASVRLIQLTAKFNF